MTTYKQNDALYSIVKEKITELIQSGSFSVEDKLPTEAEFCEIFNVSRTTVRIALQQLEFEGRITRVQGRGTFVAKPKVQTLLSSTGKGFAQQMKDQGLKPELRVIDLQVVPAGASLAKSLSVSENEPINKLVRIRYVDSEPLQYEISYIPWSIVPGLERSDCTGSLYGLLKDKYNVKFQKTVEAVEPVLADEKISSYLNIKVGASCLSIETLAYATDGTPIEYSNAIFRGDRSRFIIEREYN